MSELYVEASLVMTARPEEVYAVFCDYPGAHNSVLPKPYFREMVVTQGGQGAGTHATVHMEVYGVKRTFHLVVSEPEPGHVLAEDDWDADLHTTFTVEPVGTDRTRVTIATRSRVAPGLAGWLESLINPSITRMIYRQELANVAQLIQSRRAQPATGAA